MEDGIDVASYVDRVSTFVIPAALWVVFCFTCIMIQAPMAGALVRGSVTQACPWHRSQAKTRAAYFHLRKQRPMLAAMFAYRNQKEFHLVGSYVSSPSKSQGMVFKWVAIISIYTNMYILYTYIYIYIYMYMYVLYIYIHMYS